MKIYFDLYGREFSVKNIFQFFSETDHQFEFQKTTARTTDCRKLRIVNDKSDTCRDYCQDVVVATSCHSLVSY